MKNIAAQDVKDWQECRPKGISAKEAISFCLKRLFEDKAKLTTDEVVRGLTFEDLLGALHLAQDAADQLAELQEAAE